MMINFVLDYFRGNIVWWTNSVKTCDEKIMFKKILFSEKELNDISIAVVLDCWFIDRYKNITTGSNDITLRKVNVKPCVCDKMYMD